MNERHKSPSCHRCARQGSGTTYKQGFKARSCCWGQVGQPSMEPEAGIKSRVIREELLRAGELMDLHAQQNILKWKKQLTLLHIHRASRVPLPTLHARDPHGYSGSFQHFPKNICDGEGWIKCQQRLPVPSATLLSLQGGLLGRRETAGQSQGKSTQQGRAQGSLPLSLTKV